MSPRVSVLIPARNAAHTVSRTLASVRRQTFTDWECVVVDDGSTDATAEVVRRYASLDARFRLLRREPRAPKDGGIVKALNYGLSACRGEFIARLDADDTAARERLALQCAALEREPEWAAVGSHVRLFPRAALAPKRLDYERWLNSLDTPDSVRRDAFVECPLAHPTLFIRSETLREFAYRAVSWPEDYDLVLRLLAAGQKLGVVPQPLVNWRDSPARLSRTAPEYGLDRFVSCKAEFLAAGFLAGARDYILWGYGSTGRTLAKALGAFGLWPTQIVELHPGRLGQRILGALVIPPRALLQVPRRKVVVSVAGASARALIRAELAAMQFDELEAYVCAA
jgi:glycosyltransferase involved in cell wall biosynthesis